MFLKSSSAPARLRQFRARLLGHYVRDEHATTLQDAIRRLTSLPATNLGIKQRGWLKPGYYADVVVFDPATIQDHATFDKPDQLATGVKRRVHQRRPGDEERQAHRRQAGSRRARTRLDRMAGWRRVPGLA